MKPATDNYERRDRIIAALLWYGTWCASALIAGGMVLDMRHQSAVSLVLGLSGHQLVKAGVALFILLPVARVALMLTIFLRERDYIYVLIAALVLSIIAAGVVIRL
jgi:hypothetical protein